MLWRTKDSCDGVGPLTLAQDDAAHDSFDGRAVTGRLTRPRALACARG